MSFCKSQRQRQNKVRRIADRDGARCYWCRAIFLDPNLATLDHLIPRSRGGGGHIGNLVLACADCNGRRGAPEFTEAMVEAFTCRGWAVRA